MIAVTVKNRKAVAVPLSPVTSGAVGVPVVFSFSEDWDGLTRTAVFKGSDEEIDVLLVDDRCELPWETVEDPYGQLEIGVYGANGAGTKVIPTIWARIDRIELGTDLSGVTPAEPTPEMWAQMEELAETVGAANALIAEGYALGTQDGTPVESGTYYHNNSKYYSEQASSSAIDAGTAQTAAETAQGLAEAAQTAAETAQGKAEDAQGYAEAAQTAAETAQDKAEDAQGYAEAAQTAAETAQGKAENAQEAAETAQGKAEDAQAAAEAAAAVFVVDDELSNSSENPVQNKVIYTALGGKVDTVAGKGLSTNDYTDAEKTKLSGIEAGAEVNVQADWNQSSSGADDYIKNKPVNLVTDANYVHTDNNYTSDEKTKLSGIEAGAEVNDVTSVNTKTGAVVLDAGDIGYDETTVEAALSDLYTNKADVIVDTVGPSAIASFPDGADNMPIREITATIEPVQDLHGYSNPWPAGGGTNILNLAFTSESSTVAGMTFTHDQSSFTLKGTASGTSYSIFSLATLPNAALNTDYTFSLTISGTCPGGLFGITFKSGSTTVRQYRCNTTDATSKTFQIPSSYDNVDFTLEGLTSGLVFDCTIKVQFEKGSSKTAWQPYSNVCPIFGHTGVTVEQTGINVWDEEWELGTINQADGTNQSSSTRWRSKNLIPIQPDTDYCYVWGSAGSKITGRVCYYDASGNFLSGNAAFPGGGETFTSPAVFHTPANAYYMRFSPASGTTYENNTAINYPSTDANYHAYTGTTYPITWLGNNLINQDGTDTGNGYVHKAYIDYNGIVQSAQGDWDVLEYVPVEPSTTYTLSGTTAGAVNGYAQYSSDKTMVSYGIVNASPFTFTTGANTHFVRFNRQYSTDTQVMLNVGSSALPYEQYRMVYKGTIQINEDGSGLLTAVVRYASVSGGFTAASNGAFYKESAFDTTTPISGSFVSEFQSNYFETVKQIASGGTGSAILNPEKLMFQNVSNATRILIYTQAYSSVSDFNTALSQTPMQIIISCEPVTYNLTAEQVGAVITTLYGNNNVWADTGEVSLDYRADTKKYIDKKLAELVAQIVNS